MPRFEDDDDQPAEWDENESIEEAEGEVDQDEEDDDDANEYTRDEVLEEIRDLMEQAEDLADRGEFRKAIRFWRRHMDRFSDEPVMYYYLALTTFRLLREEVLGGGEWDSSAEAVVLHEEVLSTLDEALTMDPDNVDALNLQGLAHMLRGDHKDAVKAWEKSLSLDPEQPQVEEDLAEAREYLD